MDLNSIEKYIRNKTYPEKIKDKGLKANFRKSCKYFSIVDGHLTYKEKRKVTFENNRKQNIIHDVHEGINDNPEAIALSGHRGREQRIKKYQQGFTGMAWSMMLRTILKRVKSANNKGRYLKESALSFRVFQSTQRSCSKLELICVISQR